MNLHLTKTVVIVEHGLHANYPWSIELEYTVFPYGVKIVHYESCTLLFFIDFKNILRDFCKFSQKYEQFDPPSWFL